MQFDQSSFFRCGDCYEDEAALLRSTTKLLPLIQFIIQCSPFIMLYLGSIGMLYLGSIGMLYLGAIGMLYLGSIGMLYLGSIGSCEACSKGTILQRNCRKMTMKWSFSCNFFVKFHDKKFGATT